MANSRDFTGKNRKFTGTKGIITPKGTTGQRVGSESGELRFNTTIELMEYYDGNAWKAIDAPPTISSISTSDAQGTNNILNADGSTLHTITITGGNFGIGANVKFIGNTGTEYTAGNINRVSGSSITCKTTASMGTSDDPYDVQVINASGLSALLEDAFSFNAAPVFVTASGSLGNAFNTIAISGSTLNASATDAEGNTITYTIASGSLPAGLTIGSSTGLITGTPSANTAGVFTFTVQAATTEGITTRVFSITIKDLPTGGTITTSSNNRIHTFNSSSTLVVPSGVSATAAYLVVAGGGGGGSYCAGGGGAGGMLTGSTAISAQTYTITVGGGGPGSPANNLTKGTEGINSTALSQTAIGGGGGASYGSPSAGSGGSGGGGSGPVAAGSGTGGQGSNGGTGSTSGDYYGGGGGGGKGGVGANGSGSAAGNGGVGVSSSITGSAVFYAGGGGGSTYTGGTVGLGGNGGGGLGGVSNTNTAGSPGTDFRGGGGGSASYASSYAAGGSGGSGVVIISYDITTI